MMEDLKTTIASNLIALRTRAGMTQAELAEKLNYSDKSVSKWERAEGLPDVAVLVKLGEIFHVSLDDLVSFHEKWEEPKPCKTLHHISSRIITAIALVGIWTLALLIFVICWLKGSYQWLIFIYAVPVSLVTLLVLNSVWEKGKYNFLIIGGLILSLLCSVYLSFLSRNWWPIFLLMIPAILILFLCARLYKHNRE